MERPQIAQVSQLKLYGDCISRFGGDNPSGCTFSHPFFDELRSDAGMFSRETADGGGVQLDLSGNGPASIVRGQLVAGNYFDTLGVRPAFRADDRAVGMNRLRRPP